MTKILPLHQTDALVMPLADGASLKVTRFVESRRVAVTFHGRGGGDAGGVILQTHRARLLASWLERMADANDGASSIPRAARPSAPRQLPSRIAAGWPGRPGPARAR